MRRVGNVYGHPSTQLISAVMLGTTHLAIEGVKDEDLQIGPTSRLIKIEGQKGVKEKGAALAAHTAAPA